MAISKKQNDVFVFVNENGVLKRTVLSTNIQVGYVGDVKDLQVTGDLQLLKGIILSNKTLDVIPGNTFKLDQTSSVIDVRTRNGTGAVTILLPANPQNGEIYYIKDTLGKCLTNNIVIKSAKNGTSIEGSTTKTLSKNYDVAVLTWINDRWISLAATGVSDSAGGVGSSTDGQVLFNDADSVAGSAGLSYDKTSQTLTGNYITATTGFSGSLTKLSDGTSYLIAGSNVTITSASNGSVTISSTSGGGGASGTTNYIPKFATPTTLNDSVVQQGVGLNYIGVGNQPFITSSAWGFSFDNSQIWNFPSNTQALTINNLFRFDTSNGYLGIGTTSVAQKLHVAIYESTTSDPISNYLPRVIRLQNYNSTNGNSTSIVNFDGAGAGGNINSYIRFINIDHSKAGAITFGTSNTGGSTAGEKLRISDTGKVGIGTTSPQQLLQVGPIETFPGWTASTSPSAITLGTNYSSAAGQNLKLKLFDDGASVVNGFGISFGQMDYAAATGISHVWYIGGVETTRINSSGYLLPGANNTYDLGAVGTRWRNIYGNIYPGSSAFTAGSVIFVGPSGILAQDPTQFFWDDANNRLGILTNSPQASLDVRGDARGNNWYMQDGAASATGIYGFETSNGPAIQVWGTSTAQVGAMTFSTAGSEKMRLSNAGNVGIGTASNVTDYGTARFISYSDGNNVNFLQSDKAATLLSLIGTSATTGSIAVTSGLMSAGTSTSDPFIFFTANQEAVRITNAQKVGIGTTNPLQKLQIGPVEAVWTASTSPIAISLGTTYSSVNGSNLKLRLFDDGGSIVNGLGISFGQMDYAVAAGVSHVWYAGGVERARIDANGHFLPGANNTYDLGASGTKWRNLYATNIYGTITPTGFTQGSVVFAGVGGILTQDNSNLFWNDSTNALGIGTNSNAANAPLHVYSSGPTELAIESTTTTERSNIKFITNGSDWELGARGSAGNPNDSFYIYDNAAGLYRFVIDSSGNIGIGTTSTGGEALRIYKTSGATGAIYSNTSNASIVLSGYNSTTPVTYATDVNSTSVLVGTTTNHPLRFLTNSSEVMRLTTSQRVGIGTTDPQQLLQVGVIALPWASSTSPSTITLGTTYSNTAAQYLKLRLFDDGAGIVNGFGISPFQMDYVTATGISHVWYVGGSEWMRLNGSGNLTVNGNLTVLGTQTIVNSDIVDIKDNIILLNSAASPNRYGGIYVADTTANTTGSFIWDSNTNQWLAGLRGSEVAIPTGTGTSGMVTRWTGTNTLGTGVLYDDGTNVGIGTATANTKLHVYTTSLYDGTFVSDGSRWIRCMPGTLNNNDYNDIVETNDNALIYSAGSIDNVNSSLVIAPHATGTKGIRMNYLGQVGIGTTNPLQALQVGGAGGGYGSTSAPTSISLGSTYSDTSGTTSKLKLRLYDDGAGTVNGLGISFAQMDYSTMYGVSHVWYINNIEVVRIGGTTGNVGISSAAPGAKLDVVGGSAGTATPSIRLRNSVGVGTGYIQAGDHSTASNNWHMGSEGDGTFRFWNGNYGSGTERIRIDAGGNVGIKTTNVSQPLVVYGSILAQDGQSNGVALYMGGANNAIRDTTNGSSILYSEVSTGGVTHGSFVWRSSSAYTERMRIDANGNVGIGTSTVSATYKLHAFSSAAAAYSVIQSTVGNSGFVVLQGSVTPISGAVEISGGTMNVGTSTSHSLVFGTGGAEKVRIDTNGKVGIATTNPQQLLQVGPIETFPGWTASTSPSAITLGTTFSSGAGQNLKIRLFDDGGSVTNGFGISSSQMDYVTATGVSHVWYIGGSETTRINSSGHVLPGTDNLYNLGSAAKRWANVYATTAAASTFVTTASSTGSTYSKTFSSGESGRVTATVDIAVSGNKSFTVAVNNGAMLYDVMLVSSVSGFSVAKKYTVSMQYNVTPVTFKVIDTGPYGTYDLTVAFSKPNATTSQCTISHNYTSTVNVGITIDVAATSTGNSGTTVTLF